MEKNKKLLIVDDEEAICKHLGDFFQRRGYEVTIATLGNQALSILKDNFFPVILLDIKMPDLDGTEVLKDTVKRHPDTKVVMITGFTGGTGGITREECLSLGAYEYIEKPVDFRKLNELVNKLYQ